LAPASATVAGFLFLGELDVGFLAGQLGDALLAALADARQQLQQRVVRHDHRFHRGLGLELDLVQRLGVGRIGNGHRHLVAALGQRDHALGLHQLVVDDLGRQRFDVERADVHQRIGKGFGAEGGQRLGIDGAAGQQHINEGLLLRHRLFNKPSACGAVRRPACINALANPGIGAPGAAFGRTAAIVAWVRLEGGRS
jgi:hypothetical protein